MNIQGYVPPHVHLEGSLAQTLQFRLLITAIPILLKGSPSKIAIKVHYVYGDKSDGTAFLSEHMIISYLLSLTSAIANSQKYTEIVCPRGDCWSVMVVMEISRSRA